MSTQLNVDELKNFLKHIVKNNEHIQNEGKIPVAVNIEGDAGLGKTSAIMQLGEELSMHVVKINLSQIEEIGDLVGFPVKEFQIQNKEGKTTWITEPQIESATRKGYKIISKRMSHAVPEWIQGKSEGGFLVLDDYTRADHRFMQACMELIDRQTYISWSLPKNWNIVLTTNPDNGDYNVTSLDDAQKTRFISTFVKFDVDVWARWAESQKIDGRCINFLLMHPELVTQKINPRSITTFFNSISSIKNFEEELPLIQMIGEGSVGNDFSSMFTMFINNRLDKIISPKDILFNSNQDYITGQLRECTAQNGEFRADVSSIIGTRVVNYILHYSKTNSIKKDITDRLIYLSTECESFTNDIKYFMVKEIVNGNKTKFANLMMNKDIVDMAIK